MMNRRKNEERNNAPQQEFQEGILEGRNAVTEALKNGRTIDKLYVASGRSEEHTSELQSLYS